MMLPGWYPADLETTPLSGTVIYSGFLKIDPGTSNPIDTHGGPIAVINASVTGGTVTITLGSYDPTAGAGLRFTAERVIATVTAGASPTAIVWPLQIVINGKAIQVVLSAGTGHIRTQGKIAVVAA